MLCCNLVLKRRDVLAFGEEVVEGDVLDYFSCFFGIFSGDLAELKTALKVNVQLHVRLCACIEAARGFSFSNFVH